MLKKNETPSSGFSYKELLSELKKLSDFMKKNNLQYYNQMTNIHFLIENHNSYNSNLGGNLFLLKIIDAFLRAKYIDIPDDYIEHKKRRDHKYIFVRSIYFFVATKWGYGYNQLKGLSKWPHCSIMHAVKVSFTQFIGHPYYTSHITDCIISIELIIKQYILQCNDEAFDFDDFLKKSTESVQSVYIPGTICTIIRGKKEDYWNS
jgi:hypothetical protein